MRNPLMPQWMYEVGLAIEITASVRKLQDLATQLRALVSASSSAQIPQDPELRRRNSEFGFPSFAICKISQGNLRVVVFPPTSQLLVSRPSSSEVSAQFGTPNV